MDRQKQVPIPIPIFDGLRLTRDMPHVLWNVQWANYWDYAFVSLNGWKKGAIGIWCPDKELKYSKQLHHMTNDEGLSLSFHGQSIPPFEKFKTAKPVTWKLQAFRNGWSEAAAHFRQWRLANVKIAPRPAWTKDISFVVMGVNANKQWLDQLDSYFEGRHTERTLTFAAAIRRAGFDRNHTDNTPYDGFKEDMKAWKANGAKLMAYLNPVIMWSPKPTTPREHLGVKLADEAKTIMPSQGPDAKPMAHFDVQHLGHPGWQRWFLDWIKEYIQDYGADGIYHDEGQKTPMDNRGLVNGMTPSMGRADYHYKAQAENPDSIHGTEHQTSVNNTGVSVRIGGGILWGTAPSGMRHQRIAHASSVSNALHYPNGAIRAFPHYSEFFTRSDPLLFHWGMDQQEKRSELAGHSIQNGTLFMQKYVPFDQWVNELWLERKRATTFVWEGLRPYYPEQWDKDVVCYLRAADGDEFRYVKYRWGTALVENQKDGSQKMIYARLHGDIVAPVGESGAVPGWPIYNADGPAGLNPESYYCFDPAAKRPATYFTTTNNASPGLYEGYLKRGYVSDSCAYLELAAIPQIGNITAADKVVLVSQTEPLAVWVDGKEQKIKKQVLSREWIMDEAGKRTQEITYAEGRYEIDFRLPAQIAVLLKQPASLDELEKTIFARYVTSRSELRRPIFSDDFVNQGVTRHPTADVLSYQCDLPNPIFFENPSRHLTRPVGRFEINVPLSLPKGSTKGRFVLTVNAVGGHFGIETVQINGKTVSTAIAPPNSPKQPHTTSIHVPLSTESPFALVQFQAENQPVLSVQWEGEND